MSPGIHHVSAIVSSPRPNLAFYKQRLGLRLVKQTVNFDDSGTYHFYFGNETGDPGSLMTTFPIPRALPGNSAGGMTTATTFISGVTSLDYWRNLLRDSAAEPLERFGEVILPFKDPDDLPLEIACTADTEDLAITGLHSVSLASWDLDATCRILEQAFGFEEIGAEGDRLRFAAAGTGIGRVVDLVDPKRPGRSGRGTVHHVAFRARNEEHQAELVDEVRSQGIRTTEVKDRVYFKSVYFSEPGGVLFEIATDTPGFTVDEPLERLGTELRLPPWMQKNRDEIIRHLPILDP